MTIRDLIEAYRSKNIEKAREDARHAGWWCTRVGREALSALSLDLVLKQLDVLASRGRSPSTVAFYLRFLRRVSAWGALMGYLPADACAGMALPKERTPPMRVLTQEEEGRLCVALGPPYALWVKFALATGLKQSEQFTLRWRDVDLDRATILLPHPSTGGITALSIAPAAVALLRQLKHIQPPSMWVFPDLKNPFRAANVHSFYTGRWVAAVHRAGIAWCAWKDLRHTCGARLAKQGHPVTDILRVMRQRETRRAYIYRAHIAGRIGQPKTPLKPRDPIFAAEAVDGELRAAILRDLNNQPLTFKEGARLYAVHHLRSRPARRQFELMYQQYWTSWADRPLNSLQRREVRAWYSELVETPGAANKALTLLRSLYNWALDMELVNMANPALRLRRFPETKRDRFLTVEELHRFMTGLAHVSSKARAYLLLICSPAHADLKRERSNGPRSMRPCDYGKSHARRMRSLSLSRFPSRCFKPSAPSREPVSMSFLDKRDRPGLRRRQKRRGG